MIVILISLHSVWGEFDRIKKQIKHASNNNNDVDIGRIWAAISDIQIECEQLKDSNVKQSDNIVRCEKNLQEIDDLLGDIATKKDLDSGLDVFTNNMSRIVELLETVLNQNGQQLHTIELELDRLHDQLQRHEMALEKPQSKKTRASIAKKSPKKPVKKSRAS
jgi:chromosome segregation ATPase